jgi:hypothetical protein
MATVLVILSASTALLENFKPRLLHSSGLPTLDHHKLPDFALQET